MPGHIAEDGFLVAEVGVGGKERLNQEVWTTLGTVSSAEGHLGDEGRVGGFVLDGAARAIGGLPATAAARGEIDAAAEGALVGIALAGEGIEVVGEEGFGQRQVDFAFVIVQELVPAEVAGGGRGGEVLGVEIFGFFGEELFIEGEIRASEVAVAGALEGDVFETELEAGDFVGLVVGDEPGVGVAAVVAFLEEGRNFVDGGSILEGLAGADKLGDAGFVETLEGGDSGFGDEDAGRIDAEVVAGVDQTRIAVHDHALAAGGANVEDDVPALADGEVDPGVVGGDDLAVLGEAAGGEEGAAVFGRGDGGRGGYAVPLVVDGNVVPGEFHPAVESNDVPEVELRAFILEALGEAFELGAVFGFDAGPEDGFGGLAVEGPVFLGVVLNDGADGAEAVFDFGAKLAAMLEADFARGARETNFDPARFAMGATQ